MERNLKKKDKNTAIFLGRVWHFKRYDVKKRNHPFSCTNAP